MNACATYDDVSLILRLYDLRREEKMRQARAWFVSSFHVATLEEFQALCPPGSDSNANYRMVTSYWDMAASFVHNGVLHRDLFFESNRELLVVWERLRDILPALRESLKDPKAYHNLEAVAALYVEWVKQRGPEAYQAFSQRMRARPQQR